MARRHGSRSRVWLDGFNLSGDATGIDVSLNVDMAPAHAFDETQKHFILGTEDARASLSALFDSDSGTAAHAVIRARENTNAIFAAVYGTPEFSFGWGGTAAPVLSQAVNSQLTGAVSLSAEFQGPLHPGQTLVPEQLNSGAGNNLDNGAGSNGGAVAILQCEGVTQTGIIKVEHSVNGSTGWSDLIDFGSTSGRSAAIGAASGTVRQFVRANHAGSATSIIVFRRL